MDAQRIEAIDQSLDRILKAESFMMQSIVNPAFWVLDNLGKDLYDNQIEIIDTLCDLSIQNVAILQARGAGKTFAVAMGLMKLCTDHRNFSVGIFAPKAKQAERIIDEIVNKVATKGTLIYSMIDWKKSIKARLRFKNGSEIQTLSADETSQQEGYHFNLIIVDECLDGSSLITLADGTQQTIKQIVEEQKVKQILSYDEATKQLVVSDITNYKKIPLHKQMIEVEYEDGRKIKCTEDHKFFTKHRGWIQAKNLTYKDDIIETKNCSLCTASFIPKRVLDKFCSKEHRLSYWNKFKPFKLKCFKCNKEFRSHASDKKFCSTKCSHTLICKSCGALFEVDIKSNARQLYCSSICRKISRPKKINKCKICNTQITRQATTCLTHRFVDPIKYCINCNFRISASRTKSGKKYWRMCCSDLCSKMMCSNRMKKNNPMLERNTVEKMKKSLKRFFEMHPEKLEERLKNFMNAPYYKKDRMTKPEVVIQNFSIDGLEYTGNGTKWVTFKGGKHKNPDFWFPLKRKVVEVGDFEFWHTEEEKIYVIHAYQELGIACLYLDAKDVVKNPTHAKEQIGKFLCV